VRLTPLHIPSAASCLNVMPRLSAQQQLISLPSKTLQHATAPAKHRPVPHVSSKSQNLPPCAACAHGTGRELADDQWPSALCYHERAAQRYVVGVGKDISSPSCQLHVEAVRCGCVGTMCTTRRVRLAREATNAALPPLARTQYGSIRKHARDTDHRDHRKRPSAQTHWPAGSAAAVVVRSREWLSAGIVCLGTARCAPGHAAPNLVWINTPSGHVSPSAVGVTPAGTAPHNPLLLHTVLHNHP
jgi:hypothetical protein